MRAEVNTNKNNKSKTNMQFIQYNFVDTSYLCKRILRDGPVFGKAQALI